MRTRSNTLSEIERGLKRAGEKQKKNKDELRVNGVTHRLKERKKGQKEGEKAENKRVSKFGQLRAVPAAVAAAAAALWHVPRLIHHAARAD